MSKEKDWGAVPLLLLVFLVLLGASYAAVHFDELLFPTETMDRGGYELALAQKAVQEYPYDSLARLTLGWAHYRRGDYQEAVKELEEAVELEPDNQEIYYALGLSYMELGQRKEAEEMLLKSLELSRFPDQVYFALGDLYLAKDDYARSIEFFERALVPMPNNPEIYLRLAQAYQHQGMTAEAKQATENAALFAP